MAERETRPAHDGVRVPRRDEIYRHFKGGFYRIAAVGRGHGGALEGETIVEYEIRDADAPPSFRTLADFTREVKGDDGGWVPRFTRVG